MGDGRPRLEGCDHAEFANLYPVWEKSRKEGTGVLRRPSWLLDDHQARRCCWCGEEHLTAELGGLFALAPKVLPENQHLLPRGYEWEAASLANADPPTHTRVRLDRRISVLVERVAGLACKRAAHKRVGTFVPARLDVLSQSGIGRDQHLGPSLTMFSNCRVCQ